MSDLLTEWEAAKADTSKSASSEVTDSLAAVSRNIDNSIALMEKEAAKPADLASKGLSWAGSKLSGLGGKAQSASKAKALGGIREAGGISAVGGRAQAAGILDKAKQVGSRRLAAGGALSSLGARLAGSPGAQKAVNVGAAVLGGGGALYGANRLGRSGGLEDGRAEGLEDGATQGFNAGLQVGNQQASIDPGILGRLMEVFTGRRTSQLAMDDPEVAARRAAALRRILAGS